MGIAPASIAMKQTAVHTAATARALILTTVTITTILRSRGRTGTG